MWLELFARQGFDADRRWTNIAGAARHRPSRTSSRYFSSKNDLVWGDFAQQLTGLRDLLNATDPSTPIMDALRHAVVEFNRYDDVSVPWHRQRMELILTVPTLQADATLRYAAWRAIVTEYVALRKGLSPSDMVPRMFGYAFLAAAIAAYEHWLAEGKVELGDLLDAAIRQLERGLGEA
ncbi:mycofactocin system transcriptional regulator [Streptomyces hirsutus]